jgi:hypothetical protein
MPPPLQRTLRRSGVAAVSSCLPVGRGMRPAAAVRLLLLAASTPQTSLCPGTIVAESSPVEGIGELLVRTDPAHRRRTAARRLDMRHHPPRMIRVHCQASNDVLRTSATAAAAPARPRQRGRQTKDAETGRPRPYSGRFSPAGTPANLGASQSRSHTGPAGPADRAARPSPAEPASGWTAGPAGAATARPRQPVQTR